MTAQFTLNHPVAVTCPDCGGALRRTELGSLTQFSCHIGHVYTAEIMLAAQYYEDRGQSGAKGAMPFGVSALIERWRQVRTLAGRGSREVRR